MALQLSMPTSPLGVAFPAAYARVSSLSGNKDEVRVIIEVYANETARQAGARSIETRLHTLAMPSDAPLYPAVYDALKQLPEYADAVDC